MKCLQANNKGVDTVECVIRVDAETLALINEIHDVTETLHKFTPSRSALVRRAVRALHKEALNLTISEKKADFNEWLRSNGRSEFKIDQ